MRRKEGKEKGGEVRSSLLRLQILIYPFEKHLINVHCKEFGEMLFVFLKMLNPLPKNAFLGNLDIGPCQKISLPYHRQHEHFNCPP